MNVDVRRTARTLAAISLAGALVACKGNEIIQETPADASPPQGGTQADAAPLGGQPAPGGGQPPAGGEPPPVGGAAPPVAPVLPYPEGCAVDSDCNVGLCRLGICVEAPAQDRKANFACEDALVEQSDPDFSCWDTPQPLDLDGPSSVTMRGKIEYFGSGNVTRDLRVRVYDFATFDPSPCLDAAAGVNDITQARARVEACIDENTTPLAETTSALCEGNPTEGCYTLESVPTRLQLVIRITGDERLWVPTYEYGQFLNPCLQPSFKEDGICPEERPDAPAGQNWSCSLRDDGAGAFAELNLNVVSQVTWTTFPPTAGVARIQTNRSAIAGRQYDCQGRPVVNAAVGFHAPGARTTYFNGNPDDTLPQPGLKFTNTDATYANLDTPPGPQGVVAVAWQGPSDARVLKTVNFTRFFLVPNALVILSPSGRQPFDVEPPYR